MSAKIESPTDRKGFSAKVHAWKTIAETLRPLARQWWPLGNGLAFTFGKQGCADETAPSRTIRSPHDLGPLLEQFAETITRENSRTEEDFVTLTRDLRGLNANATKLATLVSEAVGRLRAALEQSQIGGENGMAALALRNLHTGLDGTERGVAALRGLLDELGRLGSQLDGMDRVRLLLRCSVVGFSIESARSEERRHEFNAFIDEMRSLAAQIGQRVETLSSNVSSARHCQAQCLNTLTAGLKALREISHAVESRSHTAAAETQQIVDTSLQALQQIEERTQRAAKQAGEARFHLQMGDIIRQKMEHIISAIGEAAKCLQEAAPEELPGRAAMADQLLAVQVSQLEKIQTEVAEVHEKLTRAFSKIGDETKSLAETLQQSSEELCSEKGERSPLRGFRNNLGEMEELLRRGDGIRRQAHETAKQAVTASTELTTHLVDIRLINRQLHRQALNAIIKTSALGDDGAALGVFAGEIVHLFHSSRTIVTDSVATIETIVAHAREIAPETNASSAAETSVETITQELKSGLDRVSNSFEAVKEATQSGWELVETQRWSLDATRARLDLLEELSDRLHERIEHLKFLRTALAPWKGDLAAVSSASMEQMFKQYTMESEREIYEQISRGTAPVAKEPAPAPTNDLGIDFFDFSEAPPVAEDPKVAKAGADTKSREPVSPAPAASACGMDDNIELF